MAAVQVHVAVSKLFKNCEPFSQVRLAKEAGVNKGQLSNWLKRGTNLADEKIVAIIDVLMAWLETDQAGGCKYRQEDLINQIKLFEPYISSQATAFPLQPVPATHPTYIQRNEEKRLFELIEHHPADIAVVGGGKMGKSSLLNWLKWSLRYKHNVIRVDFRTQSGDPIAIIPQAAKTAGMRDIRLKNWDDFSIWALSTLLVDEKPCTIILDDVHCLHVNYLKELADGLHAFVDQRRNQPILDRLNMVLAYDDAASSIHDAGFHSSGIARGLKGLSLVRFNESQVDALLEQILLIHDPIKLLPFANAAWELFRGHPFLTHLWAASLSEHDNKYCDLINVLTNISAEADKSLFRPFADSLDKVTRNAIVQVAIGNVEIISSQELPENSSLWLKDSGLFEVDGPHRNSRISFASDWIRARLTDAFINTP